MSGLRGFFKFAAVLFTGSVFILLFFLIQTTTYSLRLQSAELERVDMEIKEYVDFHKYNGQKLTSADCIGLILQCFGEPEVLLIRTGQDDLFYTKESRYIQGVYNETNLAKDFPAGKIYDCTVILDSNGVIKYIELQETGG